MHDSRAVANFILDHSDEKRRLITHLALQKLLYFCHAWYLAKYEVPLVSDHVEAWGHGPVFKTVYKCFKSAKRNPIKFRASRMDFASGKEVVVEYEFNVDTQQFLKDILEAYSVYTAVDLRKISHEKGGPWHQIWVKASEQPVPGMRIPNEIIRGHFLKNDSIRQRLH